MKNDFSFPKGHLIDLTHNYSAETIYWPTEEGFKLDKEFDGMTEKGYYYSNKSYSELFFLNPFYYSWRYVLVSV